MKPARAGLGRLALLAALVAGMLAAWRWRGLFDPAGLTAAIGGEPLAPLAFTALHIAGSLFFVPRTLLALGAGLVFGMWWGLLWAALGSVAGAAAGFLVARYLGAGFVARAQPERLRALAIRAEKGGWRMVAVLRLVPVIPHSVTNYALGLTPVRLGPYVVGSLAGQLPLTIAYVDLGAAGGRALAGSAAWQHEVLWPSLIGLSALLLSLLVPALARRRWRTAEPMPGA